MNELMHFNKAKRELALATKIDEVKEIRDRAEALRVYIKQAKEGLIMQNQCAEIKIRAERRGGELLMEQIPHKGGKPSQGVTVTKDFGITRMQSSRWQQIASVPEEKFEEHIVVTKEQGKELTSIDIRMLAAKLKQEEKVRKDKERIEYAKKHPEEVKIGVVRYEKSPAGYNLKITVTGEYNGLAFNKVECFDPEYIELNKNQAPFELSFPIGQAILEIKTATRAIKRVCKKYGSAIYDAYDFNWNNGKMGIYPELMRVWGEFNKVIQKIKSGEVKELE